MQRLAFTTVFAFDKQRRLGSLVSCRQGVYVPHTQSEQSNRPSVILQIVNEVLPPPVKMTPNELMGAR